MVKKLSFLFLIGLGIFGYAQSNYEKDLATQIAQLESAKSLEDFQQSRDFFAKSTGTSGGDWRSYYYTALSIVRSEMNSQRENRTQGIDEICALAQKNLNAVTFKQPDNAEANILMSQIYLLKSFKNDAESASNLEKANAFLSKAATLDQNNPRIDIVKGEIALNSPKKNEGNKELAKKYFNSALTKFKSYTRKSKLDANWGKDDAIYYLSQLK